MVLPASGAAEMLRRQPIAGLRTDAPIIIQARLLPGSNNENTINRRLPNDCHQRKAR